MKTKEIHSQEEYDKNKDFDGVLIIKCDEWIVLRGNSSAELRGNSSAELWENSSAVLRGNSSAELRGNSSAVLWENSSAVLWENSSAVLRENSSAVLWGNSSADNYDHSHALIYNKNKVNLYGNATKNIYKELNYNKSILNKCADESGMIVLYKSVNPENNTDFWTGTVKYEIGKEIVCHDWDKNRNRQCGGGFHLCMTAAGTQVYNKGKILKCLVDKNDIVVFPGDCSKVRCRKVLPVCEVDVHGREIEAKE